MTQLPLFNDAPSTPQPNRRVPAVEQFEGAVVFSAVGDALGWPTEFLKPDGKFKPSFGLPIRDFVQWKKVVGGKWWGYDDHISPGQYSDDTQLMLAVARSIDQHARFVPERFAFEELPLWLQYERGGGKSIKTAARKLVGKRADWQQNFYHTADISYRTAGANGAAMRNLPIALARVNNYDQLVRDSFYNAIITHGHPRAILGAILLALATDYALNSTTSFSFNHLLEYLETNIRSVSLVLNNTGVARRWIARWNANKSSNSRDELAFSNILRNVEDEIQTQLGKIGSFFNADAKDYYTVVGALDTSTKGSGIATVCAAIYLFSRYINDPELALLTSVNMLGSDTDTISCLLGALMGAYHGISAVPHHYLEGIQDKEYLFKTAHRLHRIASGESEFQLGDDNAFNRREAYVRILAWEIGLHEMFWDALEVGGTVYHPTLGRGTIEHKARSSVRRNEYEAKLINIRFDCGQTCVFHSRVEKTGKVSESLAVEVNRALT